MLTLAVAETPVVKVTVAPALGVNVSGHCPKACRSAETLITLAVLVVAVPNALVPAKPELIIIVAYASISTETLPKVAVTPLKATFASASGVTVPRAEVPT